MQITRLLTVIEEETDFDIFIEKVKSFFFSSDTYENFSFGSRMSSLRIFITALLVGVFAFIVAFSVRKRTVKRFVDAVLGAKAHNAETAKTLAELGLADDRAVARALRGGALSRMTSTVEGDEYNAKNFGVAEKEKKASKKKISVPVYKINPETDSFYLTEEKAVSLASIYGGKMGAAGTIILSAAVCVVLWFVLDRAVPFFLALLDSSL